MNAKQLVVRTSLTDATAQTFNLEDAKLATRRLVQLAKLLPLEDSLDDKIQTLGVCVDAGEEVVVTLNVVETRMLFDTLAYGICADLSYLRGNITARNREKAMATATRLSVLESVVLENRMLETVLDAVQNQTSLTLSFTV